MDSASCIDKYIIQQEDKSFWIDSFGRFVYVVREDRFRPAFELVFGIGSGFDVPRIWQHIRFLLGIKPQFDAPACVTLDHIRLLIEMFGPNLSNTLSTINLSVNQTWFQGFVTVEEAEHILTDQVPGTFLIRFSQSSKSSLVISYVADDHKIMHHLVEASQKDGFLLDGRSYMSIEQLVHENKNILRFAAPNTASKNRWFFGFQTYQETKQVLKDYPTGSFLMRFSRSQPGSLAIGWKAPFLVEGKNILQALLLTQKDTGGYLFWEHMFFSIESVIRTFRHIFRYPGSI